MWSWHEWEGHNICLKKKNLLAFYIQPGQISVKRFFQMIIFAILSENTVQCPKTYFLCLIYIYTFPIARFYSETRLDSLAWYYGLLHSGSLTLAVWVFFNNQLFTSWRYSSVFRKPQFCRISLGRAAQYSLRNCEKTSFKKVTPSFHFGHQLTQVQFS